MDRLRPLSETECYTRLYGQRDTTVTIISRTPRIHGLPSISGELVREAFDLRFDAREPLGPLDAEAA